MLTIMPPPSRFLCLTLCIYVSVSALGDTGLAQNADSITLKDFFNVSVEFTDGHGTDSAVPFSVSTPGSDDTAAFTFRDPRNTEVIVQILDGCSLNSHHWFFATSLTDIAYTITVSDTSARGSEWTYSNAAGQRRFLGDTMSLPCPGSGPSALQGLELTSSSGPASDFRIGVRSRASDPCDVETTACLYDSRFGIEVAFDFDTDMNPPAPAEARDPNLSEHTAAFGFFDSTEPDVAVKMIETCSHYEVHWATLSSAELNIEITDHTASGPDWTSPTISENGVDREAFVIDANCIFTGSFEEGGPWEWSSSTP